MSNVKSRLIGVGHLVIAAAIVFVVAYLNFSLIRFWFVGEFSQNMASIEISYVQMAKFWVEGGTSWQPLWYLGYPWHVFYTPLLPFLEVASHWFLGFSFAHAYRVITGLGYILVPVSTFFFVWQISKSKTGAAVSALAYSFAPTVIGKLFSQVAGDVIAVSGEPRRFTILVRWGEGPHTLALVFLPLFGLFFAKFLKSRIFLNLILASFFLSLVALTNAIVFWAAILLFVSLFIGELAKKSVEFIPLCKGSLKLLLVTGGLLSFWYNIPFLKTFFREGGGALDNWLAMFPWGLILIAVGAFGLFLLIRKFLSPFNGLSASLIWFLMMFAIVYIYYASGESRLEYFPQALRFNTEVDLSLSILVGVIISNVVLFLTKLSGSKIYAGYMVAAVVFLTPIAVLLYWGKGLVANLPEHTKPFSAGILKDINKSREAIVSKKLKDLVAGSDERVLVPGNYSFWLDFFEPIPQLRGAFYQSSTHSWSEHIYYQVTNGGDAQISLAWLKIANIGELLYTTGASVENYKDYKVREEKFSSILSERFRESGDIYFDVSLANSSLAKVVDNNKYKSIRKPSNAIDEKPITAYLSWMEEKSDRKLKVERISASHLKISGEIKEGEAVLVQNTYDSGWRVKQAGWKESKDPLDFIVLTPKKYGNFEIDLVYEKPWTVWLGYLVTIGTILWVSRRLIKGYQGKSR